MRTQHEAALAIAEDIRAFRAANPSDADRLLREYADLYPASEHDEELAEKAEEIERLEETIDLLEDVLEGARDDLEEAKARIEELENTEEEESE